MDPLPAELFLGEDPAGTANVTKFGENLTMGMKEKMHTGALYLPGDREILQEQMQRLDRLYDFNMTRPSELAKRQALLKEMFAEIGEDCYVEPPLYSNFGGGHVHFGRNIYANFHLTLVDDTHIYAVSYTHLRAHETGRNLVCRLLLEKKKQRKKRRKNNKDWVNK